MGVTLRGDRNQCPTCERLFNSTHAFDKHRAGIRGAERYCLSEEAMLAEGMHKGDDGFWRGSAMPESVHGEQS